jgi:hypothetical protein
VVLNNRIKTFGSRTCEILRPLLGYTKVDRQRNADMRDQMKVQSTVEATQNIPEELERTRRKDARREISKTGS